MLTPQERISNPPMEEHRFQPSCEIDLLLFKDITTMFPEQEIYPSTHHIAENLFYRQSGIEHLTTS